MSDKFFAKSIQIPIFRGKMVVVLASDLNKAVSKYRLNVPQEDWNDFAAFVCTHRCKNNHVSHWVLFGPDSNVTDIVHESVHIKNGIFLRRGIENDRANDETEAYLMAWIVSQISPFYLQNHPEIQKQ